MPQEAHDNAAAVFVIAQALEEHPTTDPVALANIIHHGKFTLGAAASMPGGVVEFNEERVAHGEAAVTTLQYMTSSQFWFESF